MHTITIDCPDDRCFQLQVQPFGAVGQDPLNSYVPVYSHPPETSFMFKGQFKVAVLPPGSFHLYIQPNPSQSVTLVLPDPKIVGHEEDISIPPRGIINALSLPDILILPLTSNISRAHDFPIATLWEKVALVPNQ